MSERAGIPWYSWVGLVVMLGLGVLLFTLTNSQVVTPWLRWTVTILWVIVTLAFGIHDFIVGSGSGGNKDDRPIDYWTISHGGAGLFFGVWFIPLVYVLVLVILWEVFEWLAPGFGEKEIFLNRAVDVGIAVGLWLVVVVIVMITSGAPFPLIAPYMH